MQRRSLFNRIGPAFVVGAVIIGPGSITVMSTTGATYGYQLLWLSLLAGGLMAGFIGLFMRLGIHSDKTFLTLTAERFGRWYAVLCGLALFLAGAAFQCGNNLGVTAAMQALLPNVPQVVWPILFSVTAITFMLAAKNIYRAVEKLMTVLLVGMFLAFLINLIAAGPSPLGIIKGMTMPSIPDKANWVTLGGLMGTTFVISAAFFQSYLVKAKGWQAANLKDAIIDTVLASITYTLIGTVIMATAAALLFPHDGNVGFQAMVKQLSGVFGQYAVLIFAIGFWAAAFSSFITNALISGILLADGLGLGNTLNAPATKGLATAVMIIGTVAAVIVLQLEARAAEPQTAVVAAQPATAAATAEATTSQPGEATPAKRDIKMAAIRLGQAFSLIAVPLGAVAMVVVLLDPRPTQGKRLPILIQAFVIFGGLLLLATTCRTAMGLWETCRQWAG